MALAHIFKILSIKLFYTKLPPLLFRNYKAHESHRETRSHLKRISGAAFTQKIEAETTSPLQNCTVGNVLIQNVQKKSYMM